jgi:hypothetical protein
VLARQLLDPRGELGVLQLELLDLRLQRLHPRHKVGAVHVDRGRGDGYALGGGHDGCLARRCYERDAHGTPTRRRHLRGLPRSARPTCADSVARRGSGRGRQLRTRARRDGGALRVDSVGGLGAGVDAANAAPHGCALAIGGRVGRGGLVKAGLTRVNRPAPRVGSCRGGRGLVLCRRAPRDGEADGVCRRGGRSHRVLARVAGGCGSAHGVSRRRGRADSVLRTGARRDARTDEAIRGVRPLVERRRAREPDAVDGVHRSRTLGQPEHVPRGEIKRYVEVGRAGARDRKAHTI